MPAKKRIDDLIRVLWMLPRRLLLGGARELPQRETPYARLIEENGRRQGQGCEFELLDTKF
jgi:hypothetical protein